MTTRTPAANKTPGPRRHPDERNAPATPSPDFALDWLRAEIPHDVTDRAVHVWAWPLDLPPRRLAALGDSLAPEERERASRFGPDLLRGHFIAGRGGMRAVLAGYLQVAPSEVEFSCGPCGKPVLGGAAAGRLHFNLAHSNGLALLAVTHIAALGVDVEKVRPMPHALDIAERFFSAGEIAALSTVPPAARDEAFFRLWTRKEAWLKATGDGITASLSKVEVSFLPDEPPCVRRIAGDPEAAKAWRICSLQPAAGFVGALAIPAWDVQLSCWSIEI